MYSVVDEISSSLHRKTRPCGRKKRYMNARTNTKYEQKTLIFTHIAPVHEIAMTERYLYITYMVVTTGSHTDDNQSSLFFQEVRGFFQPVSTAELSGRGTVSIVAVWSI